MMPWVIVAVLVAIAAAMAALQCRAQLRALNACARPEPLTVDVERYRPMLHVLGHPEVNRKLRTERCVLFRMYLRALTEDYGTLLAGIRLIVVQSSIDRPDLVRALVQNRLLFAVALCRVDFRLRLFALGMGSPELLGRDLRGLVDALSLLRGQFRLESAVWGG